MLLSDAIERAKIRADAAGVSIVRKGDDEPVLAWGDESPRLMQAIDHISCRRAIYAPAATGGRILARAAYDDSRARRKSPCATKATAFLRAMRSKMR